MTRPQRWIALAATVLLLPLASGCQILGYAAATIGKAPDTGAAYAGLANQRVGVMTWSDRSVRFYYSYMGRDVQSEISRTVTERLRTAAAPKKGEAEELASTTFVESKQIYFWQKNHPEEDNRPAIEVAPQLAANIPMTRLIHVELQEFMTRDPNTEFLLRGQALVNVRVIEIDPATRAARQAFEELGIQVTFPEKAPEGVPPTPTFTEETVSKGLIQQIGTAVAVRFFKHPSQE
jgi:hypothetical protein